MEETRCEDCNGTGSISVPLEPQEFCIDSDSAADWLLQKYAALDAEIVLITAQAQEAVKRLQADRQSLEHLYQGQLEAFIRQRVSEDKRGRKSLILPHGTCGFRTVPASVKIVDKAAALAYAQEHRPSCIKTVYDLDTSAYRDIAERVANHDGEVLPGVEVSPERENFHIKQGKKEEQN